VNERETERENEERSFSVNLKPTHDTMPPTQYVFFQGYVFAWCFVSST
jgi:hypothetical protein